MHCECSKVSTKSHTIRIFPNTHTHKSSNLPLGWNILETNRTVGGLLGYSSEKAIVSLKVPSSNGVSLGLQTMNTHNQQLLNAIYDWLVIT